MRGVVLEGPYEIVVHDGLPDPKLLKADDAIVKVSLCAICGSDLHPYRGEIPGFRPHCVMGHEFTGEIVESGSDVHRFKRGDRVLGSDLIACGRCEMCEAGLHYHCRQSTLFGYGEVVGEYVAGAQAEYVRVPVADTVLKHIPEGISDDKAIFVSDVLTTAYSGLLRSGFLAGDPVLVVGCGAVGLSAVQCAIALGASHVFALDPNASRVAQARAFGAVGVSKFEELPDIVAPLLGKPSVTRIIEAVGTPAALMAAIGAAGPRSSVSIIGAHGHPADGFPLPTCFVRELQLSFTVGNPLALAADVLALLERKVVDPSQIVSHQMALKDAPEAYRIFDAGDAIKVLMSPH